MDKIEELLTRGVDTIYPSKEELEKVLQSGKKLTLYQGFDPTGTQLHIGHMIGLRKLQQWQVLGHHVIFLIGDGTGQAGDPSGKIAAREKFFNQEELRKNAKEYVMQAGKIVQFKGDNPVEIRYNGDWLNKLGLVEILEIAGNFTLQQLSERDMFQERMKKNMPVNMREFLYPLLQGYDSVAMKVDLELGGSDQTFNMLVGRQLVKEMLQKEKFVMTTPLLADSEGRKIGKSEGNVIALADTPENLFGKIMGLPDDVIAKAFEYLTDVHMNEIKDIDIKIKQGDNPVIYKKQLAFAIVKQLHSKEQAQNAQEHFKKTVQNKEMPTDIQEFAWSTGKLLVDLLVESELAGSKSDAKRLIEQGRVAVDEEIITDPNAPFSGTDDSIVRVGKRKFVRIKIA